MNSLTGQEIFESGHWNGLDFTNADLDSIVASFAALNLAGRVPLKFGHSGSDSRTDGEPALGWVEKIYRQGSKLLADFSNVADEVVAAIRKGSYKFVSIELLRGVQAGSRKLPWVLDAVALLGAAQPALGSLAPLRASRLPLGSAESISFTRSQEDDDDMTTKEEFAALTKRHVALLFETAVRDGRILPRDREQFTRRYPDATAEDAEAFIRDTPKPTAQRGVVSFGGSPDQMSSRPDRRVLDAAQKRIRERQRDGDPVPGATRDQQLIAAAKEEFANDPDLAQAWKNAPGEK